MTDPAEPGYDPGCVVCLSVRGWPVPRNKSCSDFFGQVRLGPGQPRDHVPKPCAVAPTSEARAALSRELKDWQCCGGCIPTCRAELRALALRLTRFIADTRLIRTVSKIGSATGASGAL